MRSKEDIIKLYVNSVDCVELSEEEYYQFINISNQPMQSYIAYPLDFTKIVKVNYEKLSSIQKEYLKSKGFKLEGKEKREELNKILKDSLDESEEEIFNLVEGCGNTRWLAIGKTDIQKGIMALKRALDEKD